MDDLEKALVDIVRTYLSQETNGINGKEVKQEDVNGNVERDQTGQNQKDASESSEVSSEFTTNVYQCLRDKGVLKEVHAFLRYKLVDVLQGNYPQVIKSGCDTNLDRTAIDLVEDFLIAHKLLFTYSVLASELNGSYSSRRENGKYEKLALHEAEALLENLNVPKDSSPSKQILRLYSQDEHRSLIECFVDLMPTPTKISKSGQVTSDVSKNASPKDDQLTSVTSARGSNLKSYKSEVFEVIGQGLGGEDTGDDTGDRTNVYSTTDKVFLRERLEAEMNRSCRTRSVSQSSRADQNDLVRIKNEIESDLKRKLALKEAELERVFAEKLADMKSLLDEDKRKWRRQQSEPEQDLPVQRKPSVMKLVNGSLYESPQTDYSTTDDVESLKDNHKQIKAKHLKAHGTSGRPKVRFDSPRTVSNGYGHHREHPQPFKKDKVPEYQNTANLQLTSLQDDKVAFLQLSLEKQSEEIRKLQSELQSKNSQKEMEPVKLTTESTNIAVAYDPELETFLEESKRRFADIEQQAFAVTSTLRQVFQRAGTKTRVTTGSYNQNTVASSSRPQFVIPPRPSFLTDRGGFHSNLRSFLIDDAIPPDDFNFPSVLQSMPNTIPAQSFSNPWRPQPVFQRSALQPSTMMISGQQFSPVPSKLHTVRTEASTDLTRPRHPLTSVASEPHVTFELPSFLQPTASTSTKATSISNLKVDATAQIRNQHGPTPILSPPKRLNEIGVDTAEKVPQKIAEEVTSDTDLSLRLAKRSGAFVTSKIQSRSNSIVEDEPVQTRKNRSNSRDKGQVVSSNQLVREDNSVSVPDISHADGGNTSDNMAEDDFWAI